MMCPLYSQINFQKLYSNLIGIEVGSLRNSRFILDLEGCERLFL